MPTPYQMTEGRQSNVLVGVVLLLLWSVTGTVGFVLIEGWSLLDAFYMTIITISTVGYGEVFTLSSAGRLFASFLIVGGLGTAIYTFTRLGQALLEGELLGVLGRRRMNREVHKLTSHHIVCGFGRIGAPVAEGLEKEGQAFCILDNDLQSEPDLRARGYLYLIGDALDESVLASAQIDKAKVLMALLPSDADNLLLTIIAKELNPNLMVIARASDEKIEPRLKRGGADKVVSPYKLTSGRVLQAAVKPTVLEFLELVSHREHLPLRLEEITVLDTSALEGLTINESEIRNRFGVVIIAIKQPDGAMVFNPEPDQKILAGHILVVIGKSEDLKRLEADCCMS